MSEAEEMTYNSDDCKTWGDLIAKNSSLAFQDSIRRAYQRSGTTHAIAEETPLADISIKDDVSLMDIAPWLLSRKTDKEHLTLHYELKDATITVSGNAEHGIATVYDYDVVLYMISHLTKEMNKIKKIVADAEQRKKSDPEVETANPSLPSRIFKPNTDELFKFCGRVKGGRQYKDLKDSLHRLMGTTVVIDKKSPDGKRRATLGFSYINDFGVLEESEKGAAIKVSIEIPRWIYDGIVRVETPAVLTMNREYFDLSDGIHRFLHRYARKVAGFGKEVEVSVKELHHRSGSRNELKFFTRDLKKSLKKLKTNPLSDYKIEFRSKGRGKNFVVFQKKTTDKALSIETESSCPLVFSKDLEKAVKEIAPNYSAKFLYDAWVRYTEKESSWNEIRFPKKAFLGFCKKNHEREPNP